MITPRRWTSGPYDDDEGPGGEPPARVPDWHRPLILYTPEGHVTLLRKEEVEAERSIVQEMDRVTTVPELAARWREDAAILRRRGANSHAEVLDSCASELEAAFGNRGSEELTLSQAARESGYSPEHLSRLVRRGLIPNAGRKGAPRVRRHDLPAKPGSTVAATRTGSYDPATDARSLVGRRKGGAHGSSRTSA